MAPTTAITTGTASSSKAPVVTKDKENLLVHATSTANQRQKKQDMNQDNDTELNLIKQKFSNLYIMNNDDHHKDVDVELDCEEEDHDSNWDDWIEEEEGDDENMSLTCLFCNCQLNNLKLGLEHMQSTHDFDLMVIKSEFDFYEYVKAINFIRSQTKQGNMISMKELLEKRNEFQGEEYLKTQIEDDTLICAFDSLEDLQEESPEMINSNSQKQQQENRVKELQEELDQLKEAFTSYRNMAQSYLLSQTQDDPSLTEKLKKQQIKGIDDEDEAVAQTGYYFAGYGSNDIHEEMLKDQVRTDSYRDFVYLNKDLFKDKVVLDVGCGTGILSLFAAKAGAKKVIAVDNANIINKAKQIAKDNGLDHIVTFVKGRIEQIEMPVKEVDIIISEWMGYFLLFEGMLDSVLVARDLYMKPDGMLCPSQSKIIIAAMEGSEYMNERYHFWNDVYGFNMNTMKDGFYEEAQIEIVPVDAIVSTQVSVHDIDIRTTSVRELDFESNFELTMTRDSKVHGICGWFDILFDSPQDKNCSKQVNVIKFSTGPQSNATHWKQTCFLFKQSIELSKGSTIFGRFKCRKSSQNFRELVVNIEFSVRDSQRMTTAVLYEQKYFVR